MACGATDCPRFRRNVARSATLILPSLSLSMSWKASATVQNPPSLAKMWSKSPNLPKFWSRILTCHPAALHRVLQRAQDLALLRKEGVGIDVRPEVTLTLKTAWVLVSGAIVSSNSVLITVKLPLFACACRRAHQQTDPHCESNTSRIL